MENPTRLFYLIGMSLIMCGLLHGATGTISGSIRDIDTGKPLAGANVLLEGTALGAAANIDGIYQVSRVPEGEYTLIFSYIGHQTVNRPVSVKAGETIQLDVELSLDVVRGSVVVVTAQLEGQAHAINMQLTSNTITNVVSAERIQELPDANAAESVGRLPGISIKRDGGEGSQIVIRGLAPTYNTITIGGEKIPATDLDDRGVDLAMISPEILAGIEVTKALTPDKDADSFGGTVNFILADAPEGGFRSNLRFRQGYNAQRDELGQYKGSMTLSNRYLEEQLGIMVTANIERSQRGSDQFEGDYKVIREKREGEKWAPIQINSIGLDYGFEIRERKGASLLMDYQLPNGKLMVSNFMSRLNRSELIFSDNYSSDSNVHSRRIRERIRQIDILTNSVSGEHELNLMKIDWRLSRTSSHTRHPFNSRFRFNEDSAFDSNELISISTPDQLIAAAKNNLDNAYAYKGEFFAENSIEANSSGQFNMKLPFTLTRQMAGHLKIGGKYDHKSKERDRGRYMSRLDEPDPEFEYHHTRYGEPDFEYQRMVSGHPLMYNYLDPDFEVGTFLGGLYDTLNVFAEGLDNNELHHLLRSFLQDSLYDVSTLADLDDYETIEEVSAGYIMAELNFGRFLMVLPGVRYERTSANMTGRRGIVQADFDEPDLDAPFISDTTAQNDYTNWFPMMHLRVRPAKWFDIRLAYTKSVSRPQLNWMLPKRKILGQARTVELGRPDLKPQLSTNYDIFLSIYGRYVGLLTLGGFYKEIENLIFKREGHLILNSEEEGFATTLEGFTLERAENNPFVTTIKGLEIEWQTNFHWLPRPFNGLVLNINYTHILSDTRFPRSLVDSQIIPVFPFVIPTVIDTFRTGQMPDQPDDIANIAIGYDTGPFSARLSMLYQGRTLTLVGERPELDGFTADLVRWDLSIKYKISDQIGLYYSLNNFTNYPDEAYQHATRYLTTKEVYGWTTDLGMGFKF